METIDFIKWGVFAAMGLVLWFFKQNVNQTKEDIKELRTEVNNRLHKDDFKEFKLELRAMFEEIRQDIRLINKNEKS